MRTAVYTLQDFVEDARRIVSQGLSDGDTVEALTPLLQRVVAQPDCLDGVSDRSGPIRGSSVYTDENLTIRVVPWKPGSSTPVHNHNSWVLIGGVKGNERNTNYRRLDDGSRPWHARLEEAETVDIRAGICNSLLPPHDIHAVTIPEGEAVALHVYGTDLGREWRFQFNLETGEVSPFGRGDRD